MCCFGLQEVRRELVEEARGNGKRKWKVLSGLSPQKRSIEMRRATSLVVALGNDAVAVDAADDAADADGAAE